MDFLTVFQMVNRENNWQTNHDEKKKKSSWAVKRIRCKENFWKLVNCRCFLPQMLVTVLWNWAWCPIGCRAAWTPCRASGRTRGTGSRKVQCYSNLIFLQDPIPDLSVNEPITTSSTVSYINYGPFTSYAPTYDSSFANISKEDSDLIYSSYGEESSLQGSDRYARGYHKRTQALWHLHKTSLESAFPTDYFPDVSLFKPRASRLEEVSSQL